MVEIMWPYGVTILDILRAVNGNGESVIQLTCVPASEALVRSISEYAWSQWRESPQYRPDVADGDVFCVFNNVLATPCNGTCSEPFSFA